MWFRLFITGLTMLAGAFAALGAITLFVDGRTGLGILMAATAVVVTSLSVATWTWSAQADPVKGIHY